MKPNGWKIITNDVDVDDPAVEKLWREAIAAAPAGFVDAGQPGSPIPDTVALLPRRPLRDHCRLCGLEADLTQEHIPPRASGNKVRHQKQNLDDWLNHGPVEDFGTKRKIEQGGIYGYTLCSDCNSLTGRLYGGEYKRWVAQANAIIAGFPATAISSMDQQPGPFGQQVNFGTKKDGGVKPGAFVRQVLSCMCSLSGPWDLAGRHPELRRIILNQSTEPLPTGLELGFVLYLGPHARITGPQLSIDVKAGVWRWLQELAFPPFAFRLVIASNHNNPGLGLMMGDWTGLKPSESQLFTGLVEIGFGWSPYPGDYRSRRAINGAAPTV